MLSRDVFLRRFKSSLSWLRGLAAAKEKQNVALSKWAVLFFLALPQPRKQCSEALGKHSQTTSLARPTLMFQNCSTCTQVFQSGLRRSAEAIHQPWACRFEGSLLYNPHFGPPPPSDPDNPHFTSDRNLNVDGIPKKTFAVPPQFPEANPRLNKHTRIRNMISN